MRPLRWLSSAGVVHLSVPGDELTRCGRSYSNMKQPSSQNSMRYKHARKCRVCHPSLFMDAD